MGEEGKRKDMGANLIKNLFLESDGARKTVEV